MMIEELRLDSEYYDLKFEYDSNACKIYADNIVDYCYQIDENEIPFHYRLKHINKVITNYDEKVSRKNICFDIKNTLYVFF